MKIATWNVNSLKTRLEDVKQYLIKNDLDFLLLQEIKGLDENIYEEFSKLGYKSYHNLQKTYNGVAILTKYTNCQLSLKYLPNFSEDIQARFIEIIFNNVHIICVYVPNGNPIGTDKYEYKVKWLECLYLYLRELSLSNKEYIIGGDFNIAPRDIDTYSAKNFRDDAITQKKVRDIYFSILNLGNIDVLDHKYHQQSNKYTWWDYRNSSFAKDRGLRIDHIILSPKISNNYQDSFIDKTPRISDKPSDHTPVICVLEDFYSNETIS